MRCYCQEEVITTSRPAGAKGNNFWNPLILEAGRCFTATAKTIKPKVEGNRRNTLIPLSFYFPLSCLFFPLCKLNQRAESLCDAALRGQAPRARQDREGTWGGVLLMKPVGLSGIRSSLDV